MHINDVRVLQEVLTQVLNGGVPDTRVVAALLEAATEEVEAHNRWIEEQAAAEENR